MTGVQTCALPICRATTVVIPFEDDADREVLLGDVAQVVECFDASVLACCACGGKLILVAVMVEPTAIEKILKHIGLDPQPLPRAAGGTVWHGLMPSIGQCLPGPRGWCGPHQREVKILIYIGTRVCEWRICGWCG